MATANQLQSEITQLSDSKTKLNSRLEALKKIKLESTVSDYINDCNRYITRCYEKITDGLKGTTSSAANDVLDKKESYLNSSSLQNVAGYISLEIARCQQEIDSLTTQISSKQSDLENALEQEATTE